MGICIYAPSCMNVAEVVDVVYVQLRSQDQISFVAQGGEEQS